MPEKGFRDSSVFHGTNRAGWEQQDIETRYAHFWTNDPREAFTHALENGLKFNSEPVLVVHLAPDGAKFEDITTGSNENRRTYGSKTRFDETGNELEVYGLEDFEQFFSKYMPQDIEHGKMYIEHYKNRIVK